MYISRGKLFEKLWKTANGRIKKTRRKRRTHTHTPKGLRKKSKNIHRKRCCKMQKRRKRQRKRQRNTLKVHTSLNINYELINKNAKTAQFQMHELCAVCWEMIALSCIVNVAPEALNITNCAMCKTRTYTHTHTQRRHINAAPYRRVVLITCSAVWLSNPSNAAPTPSKSRWHGERKYEKDAKWEQQQQQQRLSSSVENLIQEMYACV